MTPSIRFPEMVYAELGEPVGAPQSVGSGTQPVVCPGGGYGFTGVCMLYRKNTNEYLLVFLKQSIIEIQLNQFFLALSQVLSKFNVIQKFYLGGMGVGGGMGLGGGCAGGVGVAFGDAQ